MKFIKRFLRPVRKNLWASIKWFLSIEATNYIFIKILNTPTFQAMEPSLTNMIKGVGIAVTIPFMLSVSRYFLVRELKKGIRYALLILPVLIVAYTIYAFAQV